LAPAPGVSRSITVTARPRRAVSQATAQPMSPPPTTTRSGVPLPTDPDPLLLIRFLEPDVVLGALDECLDRFLRELLAHPRGDPRHQRPGRDDHPLRDEARSTDDRILADHRLVQEDRIHPDQRAPLDAAAL